MPSPRRVQPQLLRPPKPLKRASRESTDRVLPCLFSFVQEHCVIAVGAMVTHRLTHIHVRDAVSKLELPYSVGIQSSTRMGGRSSS